MEGLKEFLPPRKLLFEANSIYKYSITNRMETNMFQITQFYYCKFPKNFEKYWLSYIDMQLSSVGLKLVFQHKCIKTFCFPGNIAKNLYYILPDKPLMLWPLNFQEALNI